MNKCIKIGFGFFFLYIMGCSPKTTTDFDYGTKNDSARYYFHKGWAEIMDNGRWTESEQAFRKVIEIDPDWVLGKSMVARITRNLEERQQILKELEQFKSQISEDERLLLDVNILTHIASNNRDQGIPNTPEFNQKRFALAEQNFGAFARKYPEDNYFKAEYIEFLHANHGAQTALDSLNKLATSEQKQLGFYISYAAALELELGNIDNAIKLSEKLEEIQSNPSYTSSLMLQAQILIVQDSIEKAYQLVNKVVAMDSNHIIARGTQARLKQQLETND